MKRGTPDHPKLLDFAALLELPRWGAVGILESLFHFAATYAHAGDIGRHSDGAIARGLDWRGDVPALIAALVKARWLDRCKCHRLRVHDWPTHADQTVQRALIARKQDFIPCYDDPSSLLAESELPLPLPLPTPKPEPIPTDSVEPSLDHARLRPPTIALQVMAVFDHWREVCGHPDGKLTTKRRKAVDGRIRDGYTVEQLMAAIEGCRTSPWHQGANDRGKVYDDLELICRSGEKVEGFLDRRQPQGPRAPPTAAAQARQDAANALISGGGRRDQRQGVDAGDGPARSLLPGPGADAGDGAASGPGLPR